MGVDVSVVAIYRLLQRTAFEPEHVRLMVEAYEKALEQLELKDRDDPLTETIARYVVEVTQTGEADPDKICAIALSYLRDTDRKAS